MDFFARSRSTSLTPSSLSRQKTYAAAGAPSAAGSGACGDFDIAPSLVDADAILSLYRAVEKQKKARGLAYAQFLDLLALVARAALLDELATDAACVNALLYRWGLADPVRLEGLRRG